MRRRKNDEKTFKIPKRLWLDVGSIFIPNFPSSFGVCDFARRRESVMIGEEKKLLYFSAVCNCENKLVATFWDGKPADFTCSKCKKKYLFCVSNELTPVMDYLKRLEK